MKTKLKSVIRAGCHLFARAVCAAAFMMISSSAQTQNLFEADWSSGKIYEFTPGGVESTFASGLTVPEGLAFNSAGDLFVADYYGGNIYEFTPGGTRSAFATGLSGPEALAFNSAGDLFVADWGSDNIYEFTPEGTRSIFALGLLLWPTGLAFNNAGDLFEADSFSGKIYEFTPDGVRSTFASGLNYPTGLAFQPEPAPEPSAFGLMAVGATALFVCQRRKLAV
jgi:sugar lactone lactonase YvrE